MTPAVYVVVAGVVGACIGSFLNVVVWRLPRGESLLHPPSRCPGCGARIGWRDNVPVLSWLWLRARCRRCKAVISFRYPLVEALTAGLFVLAALRHGPEEWALAASKAAALAALVAISAIDWDHRIIPDAISKPGIVLGLLLALLVPGLHDPTFVRGVKPGLAALLEAAAGAALGWLVIALVRWVATRVFRKEAMGLGDAKLLALIGAFTRPIAVFYTLMIGSLVGAVVGSLLVLARSRQPLAVVGTLSGPDGERKTFSRVRVGRRRLWVEEGAAPAAGTPVKAHMTFSAADLAEEEDLTLDLAGTVEGGAHRGLVPVALARESDEEAESLRLFALSRHSIPFGPFLALGGALMLLYGDEVVRFVAETWPAWVRGDR